MEKTRLNLTVDSDIPDLLEKLAGGRNKMGDYLSNLVRNMPAGNDAAAEMEQMSMEMLRLMVQGLAGRMRAMEAQHDQVIASLTTLVLERCACCDEVLNGD